MMNKFMRASEMIDRISVQPVNLKYASKKQTELIEELKESKTGNFDKIQLDSYKVTNLIKEEKEEEPPSKEFPSVMETFPCVR